MGNSQSSSATSIDQDHLRSIATSFPQLQVEDEQLYVMSSPSQPTIRYDTRQYSHADRLALAEELRQSSNPSSNNGSSDRLAMMETGPRVPLAAQSTTSLQGDQLNLQAAILIIQELTKTATPAQLAVLQKAVASIAPAQTQGQSACTEQHITAKDVKMIRRKTLPSPGIATRHLDNKRASKTVAPASADTVSPQAWSRDMFGQSPLSKLAGWQSANDGKPEIARSATPDFNGSYLGAHQLGSLRVINRTPVASIYENRPRTGDSNLPNSPAPEDYYTASEDGRNSPDKIERSEPNTPVSHIPISRTIPRIPMLQFDDTDIETSFASSAGDTTLNTTEGNSEAETTEIRACALLTVSDPIERPLSALVMYSPEATSNPFLAQQEPEESKEVKGHAEGGLPQTNISHESSEIPFVVESAEALETAEQGARVHDPLEESSKDRSATSLEPGTLSASSSVYSSGAKNTQNVEATKSLPLRARLDSGYGSQNSIITYRNDKQDEDLEPSGNMDQVDNSMAISHTSPPRHTVTEQSTRTEENDNQIFVPDREPKLPQLESLTDTHEQGRPKSFSTSSLPRTPRDGSPFSTVGPPVPAKQTLNSQPNSATASPSSKRSPKKLQKRRPVSNSQASGPLIFQVPAAERCDFGELPRVPSIINLRHRNRIVENPNMDFLEHTYKSVSHSASRDSSISEKMGYVPIRFPSPSPSVHNGRIHRRRKSEADRPASNSFLRSISRNHKPRKSSSGQHTDEDDVPIGVADLGDVSRSLGSSPYDLAQSLSKRNLNVNKELPEDPGAIRYPHQMGMQTPVKKRGMDDKTASAFAQQRSRDRAEMLDALSSPSKRMPVSRYSESRAHQPRERPHSFHSIHSVDAPHESDSRRRPTSQTVDAKNQAEEAMPTASWPPEDARFDEIPPAQSHVIRDENVTQHQRQQIPQITTHDKDSRRMQSYTQWQNAQRALNESRSDPTVGDPMAKRKVRSSDHSWIKPHLNRRATEESLRYYDRRNRADPASTNQILYQHHLYPPPRDQPLLTDSNLNTSLSPSPSPIPGSGLEARPYAQIRASSPSPSVRERAAAFETRNAVAEPLIPDCPTRRAPSPPKRSHSPLKTSITPQLQPQFHDLDLTADGSNNNNHNDIEHVNDYEDDSENEEDYEKQESTMRKFSQSKLRKSHSKSDTKLNPDSEDSAQLHIGMNRYYDRNRARETGLDLSDVPVFLRMRSYPS